jgi:Protein of unknown function (DUF1523)
MMRKVKWTIYGVLAIILLAFLHYTLPQRDIVRIVGVRQEPMQLGWENRIFYSRADSGMTETDMRTIKLIDTVDQDGDVHVYRNEDTGWGWPPFLKFDSQNVQALAQDQTSTQAAPKWVIVTHYGWRSELITIFPNTVSITPIADPNVRLIPWLNIVILTTLLVLVLLLRRMWLQFRERMIDPTLADVDASVDAARAKATGFFGRIAAWIRTWR